jgi:hypothetical protein
MPVTVDGEVSREPGSDDDLGAGDEGSRGEDWQP